MGATHYAIIKSENGEASQYRLKRWIRQNIDTLPADFNPNRISHALRRSLKQLGWRLNIMENEVFVIKPDNDGNFDYANDFFEELEAEEEEIEEMNEQVFEITFGLERDMQNALRQNIETLENGLRIIDNGRERNTIAGRIDITAEDINNNKVIIELKAIAAKPEVIAQILSYMEAVKNEDDCNVRGIIVASSFPERVKLAARQIENLKLVEYRFQFNFNEIA